MMAGNADLVPDQTEKASTAHPSSQSAGLTGMNGCDWRLENIVKFYSSPTNHLPSEGKALESATAEDGLATDLAADGALRE